MSADQTQPISKSTSPSNLLLLTNELGILTDVGRWRGLGQGDGKRSLHFCPRCGSLDLLWLGAVSFAFPMVECRDCGHRGIYLEGDEELVAAVRKGYLDRKAGISQEDVEDEGDEE